MSAATATAAAAVWSQQQARKILIASPREEVRRNILKMLPFGGAEGTVASGGAETLVRLAEETFGTLLLDPNLDDLDAEELVATIRARYPQLNIVLLEEDQKAGEEGSLDASRVGMGGVAPEEVQIADVLAGVGMAEPAANLAAEASEARSREPAASQANGPLQSTFNSFNNLHEMGDLEVERGQPYREARPRRTEHTRVESLPGMIGTSWKMQQICRLARLIAPRDTAVLIVGSTGTGKELVSRAIHDLSRRSRGPFVVVNCAAIPESLLEAELFGFTRGAFTGAFQSRLGRIHAAHGGTLLLDEVGELPLSMQAKLLRFVQEGEVQRLGSADLFRVDARVIAATNADLAQRVREKQFREDLYYRLAVFPLDLPSLRNRAEDIVPLAEHFLEILCRKAGAPDKRFSPEAATVLKRHSWPGNVRELQHSVERAFVLAEADEQIRPEDLMMPATLA